jgi:uncharacterized membrane protein YbhN (UPF0104 family)
MTESETPPSTRSTLVRRIGFVMGVVLLCAAAVYLIANPAELRTFADHIRHAPAWAIVLVLFGPVLNWLFVSQCLWSLNRRHGIVGRVEMLILVGSAWLLNHLPMRPGLVGRIGYHSKVNQIRIRDAVEASVWSLAHAIIANFIGLGVVLLLEPEIGIGGLALALGAPAVVLLLLGLLVSANSHNLGLMIMALMWRYSDLIVWMLRYAAAFTMLGVQITPFQVVLITAVSQAAQIIPITGGGIGFREWGVGLAATLSKGSAIIDMRTAIGADLINRVAETIIVIPLGLVCTALVTRRFRAALRAQGVDSDSAEDQTVRHAKHEYETGQTREQDPSDH